MPIESSSFGENGSLFVPVEEVVKRVKNIAELNLEQKIRILWTGTALLPKWRFG
jgi:hypothetical protein